MSLDFSFFFDSYKLFYTPSTDIIKFFFESLHSNSHIRLQKYEKKLLNEFQLPVWLQNFVTPEWPYIKIKFTIVTISLIVNFLWEKLTICFFVLRKRNDRTISVRQRRRYQANQRSFNFVFPISSLNSRILHQQRPFNQSSTEYFRHCVSSNH